MSYDALKPTNAAAPASAAAVDSSARSGPHGAVAARKMNAVSKTPPTYGAQTSPTTAAAKKTDTNFGAAGAKLAVSGAAKKPNAFDPAAKKMDTFGTAAPKKADAFGTSMKPMAATKPAPALRGAKTGGTYGAPKPTVPKYSPRKQAAAPATVTAPDDYAQYASSPKLEASRMSTPTYRGGAKTPPMPTTAAGAPQRPAAAVFSPPAAAAAVPAKATPPPPHSEWTTVTDPHTQRQYEYNTQTKETRWLPATAAKKGPRSDAKLAASLQAASTKVRKGISIAKAQHNAAAEGKLEQLEVKLSKDMGKVSSKHAKAAAIAKDVAAMEKVTEAQAKLQGKEAQLVEAKAKPGNAISSEKLASVEAAISAEKLRLEGDGKRVEQQLEQDLGKVSGEGATVAKIEQLAEEKANLAAAETKMLASAEKMEASGNVDESKAAQVEAVAAKLDKDQEQLASKISEEVNGAEAKAVEEDVKHDG